MATDNSCGGCAPVFVFYDYDVAVANHEGIWKLTFMLHGRLINGFMGMTEGEVIAKTWLTLKNRVGQ